jgi:hypothetical protein
MALSAYGAFEILGARRNSLLDGAILIGENNSSLTLNAGTLSVKPHSLTVFVVKSGVEYSKRVTFTVTE